MITPLEYKEIVARKYDEHCNDAKRDAEELMGLLGKALRKGLDFIYLGYDCHSGVSDETLETLNERLNEYGDPDRFMFLDSLRSE